MIVYMIFKINTNISNRRLHVGYQISLSMSNFFLGVGGGGISGLDGLLA
jgi:hypothetical protein